MSETAATQKMQPTNYQMLRRDFIESRKDYEAAEKRLKETAARFKETRARLLDLICNGNQETHFDVVMPVGAAVSIGR